MSKNKLPVRFTGQHFTIDKDLIANTINIAKVKGSDVVLDIGGGKGYITDYLIRQSNCIIVIENDESLVRFLRKKFINNANVKVIHRDFRNYTIPKTAFKVVSNIPYGITSDVLKSLMFDNVEHFIGGSLIMQLEPVQKMFSRKIFNPYTVFYHTFFDLKHIQEIAPESFRPPPTVKSALLKIERKRSACISISKKEKYIDFLFFILKFPDIPIRTALKKLFRKRQVREISTRYGINLNRRVVHLSVNQWTGCFLEMLDRVPEKYHPKR